MGNAAPPPLCRASAVQRAIGVQGATQGLLISLGLDTGRPCRLPARPKVQVLVSARPVRVAQTPLRLSTEDVPRRTIRPKQPATAILHWSNWCGRRGPVALRLTLGGVTIVERLTASVPQCVDTSKPSTLGVSLFVRR